MDWPGLKAAALNTGRLNRKVNKYERLDPDPVLSERLDPDPVNIRPDPKPWLCLRSFLFFSSNCHLKFHFFPCLLLTLSVCRSVCAVYCTVCLLLSIESLCMFSIYLSVDLLCLWGLFPLCLSLTLNFNL